MRPQRTLGTTEVPSGGPVLATRLGRAKAAGARPKARKEMAIIVKRSVEETIRSVGSKEGLGMKT